MYLFVKGSLSRIMSALEAQREAGERRRPTSHALTNVVMLLAFLHAVRFLPKQRLPHVCTDELQEVDDFGFALSRFFTGERKLQKSLAHVKSHLIQSTQDRSACHPSLYK
jgi:hypothetical protein